MRQALSSLLLLAFLFAGGGGLFAGCASQDPYTPPTSVPPGWADSLAAHRARIDDYFASPRSPLSDEQRARFTRIAFFPPDSTLYFVVRPDTADAGRPVTLTDSANNVRHYRVHSRLHLQMEQAITLTVYEPKDPPQHLFLGFQDATAGAETYGAGRYLDLPPGPGGTLIVDFNRAKNPFCAYSDDWACPLTPAENVIPVAIRAGEMNFADGPH